MKINFRRSSILSITVAALAAVVTGFWSLSSTAEAESAATALTNIPVSFSAQGDKKILDQVPKLNMVETCPLTYGPTNALCYPCQQDIASLPLLPRTGSSAPSVIGQWSSVIDLPIAPIHLSLLPNGKLLGWSGYTGPGDVSEAKQIVWDPAQPNAALTATTPFISPTNIFCSGHSFLPDGRLLVTGGQNGPNLTEGIANKNIYDYRTGNWEQPNPNPNPILKINMNKGRWYPTNLSLTNGEQIVLSGSYNTNSSGAANIITNPEVELYRPASDSWRLFDTAQVKYDEKSGLYPWTYLTPTGKVFVAGYARSTYFIDPIGGGLMIDGPVSNYLPGREYGSSVTYGDGKIMIVGGKASGAEPTKTTETIDFVNDPVWKTSGELKIARTQATAVALPNGKVLAVGGSRTNCFSDDRAGAAALSPELWDPATGQWSLMAQAAKPRVYHSAALLLPDGRVAAAGGSWFNNELASSGCGQCNKNNVQANLEIYSPPYLFNSVGGAAQRPSITTAPTPVGFGTRFLVETPNAAAIRKVSLIRLPSVTHAFNQDQHFTYLNFSVAPGGLKLTAPATGRIAPPGHYMLFIVDEQGVPSHAKIIQLKDENAEFRYDFDGEGQTNLAIWRPSARIWAVGYDNTNKNVVDTSYGLSDDVIAPGDYDGDGKIDLAIFRPSNSQWHILNSSSNTMSYATYGSSADQPVSADYDGDNKTDIAIWRPSTGEWAVLKSSTGASQSTFFGQNGDKPALGDYDGDGRADYAVFRPSNGYWYILKSSETGMTSIAWGTNGDKAVPADYDGDGKTDVAVWRPSNGQWSIIRSLQGNLTDVPYGTNGDVPTPGDYDADGRADLSVWRPSNGEWSIQKSSTGTSQGRFFGTSGDVPIPSAYIR